MVIGLIGNRYKIEIIYSISIVVICLISLILIFSDYYTKEDLIKGYNYGKLKLTFNFIINNIIIYVFAGFISLLPNKLLDDYIKKNKITDIKHILSLFGIMNFVIGFSVTIKNFANYHIIKKYGLDSNYSILALEILIFLPMSSIFLFFSFFF